MNYLYGALGLFVLSILVGLVVGKICSRNNKPDCLGCSLLPNCPYLEQDFCPRELGE